MLVCRRLSYARWELCQWSRKGAHTLTLAPTHTGIKRLCGWPKLYFSIFEFELMKLAICAELIGQLETT